ncbi:MAG: hypothetical protein ACXAC7_20565 [Candidatus Hodarchaeales archaeon]|jgi:hypothetical protein
MNQELIVNIFSAIVLFFSGLILLWVALKIYKKNPETVYYEYSFIFGLVSAGISSFFGGIFRIPYILSEETNSTLDIWFQGSFVYYFIMCIGLTFLLASGLAIYEPELFKRGFLGFTGLFLIVYAYFIPQELVEAVPGKANIEMTILGAILVYGVLGLMIVANAITYGLIYYQTKNFGSKMMFFGCLLFFIAAITGAFSDVIGELGRLFDIVGYFVVLIGLLTIAYGFNVNLKDKI